MICNRDENIPREAYAASVVQSDKVYIHERMHAYIHTHTVQRKHDLKSRHTYILTYIHTYIHTQYNENMICNRDMHAYIHTYIHSTTKT